jgi:anti-sigma factor RsiW
VNDEFSCQEMIEVVTNYLDDALPPDERQRFERHLSYCAGCGTYLDQMRETIRLVGELPEQSVPDATWNRLRNAFRDWKQSGPQDSSSSTLADTPEG